MNGAHDEPLPPEQPWAGWFEPTPEKLIEQLPSIRARLERLRKLNAFLKRKPPDA